MVECTEPWQVPSSIADRRRAGPTVRGDVIGVTCPHHRGDRLVTVNVHGLDALVARQ
ncbi:hypothetical protein ACIBG0_30290 [Nocardia sp. NPDC050630]|uniref:hypothetical protein n=1 Tax=Nocardia sp. NPDC050630 TaxID=3364321 RepID=UPI0037AF7295